MREPWRPPSVRARENVFKREWPEMARVLIVDDERYVRNALVEILVEAGYDVLDQFCLSAL